MLLVIAGAGASYDAFPHDQPHPFTPAPPEDNVARLPLANQLFEPRPRFFDVMRLVAPLMDIQHRLFERTQKMSVEDVLASFASQVGDNPRRAVQLTAAKFYIRDIIEYCEQDLYRKLQVPTNMMTLVDQILHVQRNPALTTFLTFNYDRLIENSLENRGYNYDSLSKYTDNMEQPNLVKLHGSVNWIHHVADPTSESSSMRPYMWESGISNRIRRCQISTEFEQVNRDYFEKSTTDRSIPAIAIPTRDKSFECPSPHQAFLEELIPQVTKIITIGWRGAEKTFERMVRKHQPNSPDILSICGTISDEDRYVKQRMQEIFGAGASVVALPVSFSRAANSGVFEDFIGGKRVAWDNNSIIVTDRKQPYVITRY